MHSGERPRDNNRNDRGNDSGWETLAVSSRTPIQREPSPIEQTFGDTVNYGEITRECRKYTKKMEEDKAKIWDIIDAHKNNYRVGNEELARWLSDLFEIGLPEIRYRFSGGSDASGAFLGDDYSIIFYYDRDRSKRGNVDDLNTIAHEMWHAFQFNRAAMGEDDRSRLYEFNDRCYITPQENWGGYAKQLMEREAFRFGDEVERIFSRNIQQGEDVVTKFIRIFRFR